MKTSTFILTVLSSEKARMLSTILNGIGVQTQTARSNAYQSFGAPDVAVIIRYTDIPAILRLLEANPGYEDTFQIDRKKLSTSNTLLVPIDFSPYSDLACRFAFSLAELMGSSITLLHVFFSPNFPTPFPDADPFENEIEEQDVAVEVQDEVEKRVERYKAQLKASIEAGELPDVPFEVVLADGIPEEEISRRARTDKPNLIVMGTRGRHRKELDLLGSVTAEVIDAAAAPVFAIPENSSVRTLGDIHRLAFVTNFDDRDLLGFRSLLDMDEFADKHIQFIYLAKKRDEGRLDRVTEQINDYFTKHYPGLDFALDIINEEELLKDADEIIRARNIDVLVLTTHKRNVFARLFNPSLAHRVLFHSDTPLLIIRN